jgi:predicted nucleic acid-binding protein
LVTDIFTTTFIDSNIIADWMLFDAIRETKGQTAVDTIREHRQSSYSSYCLLEELRKNKNISLFYHWVTSQFAQAEIMTVMLDGYAERRLADRTGATSRYMSKPLLRQLKFEAQDVREFFNQLERFRYEFILGHNHMIRLVPDTYRLRDIILLVAYSRLETSDAFLVSTALSNQCDCFLTRDGNLIKSLKKSNMIKPTHPQPLLSEINQRLHSTKH